MDTQVRAERRVLEAFLIDNPELERLELLLGEFNLFEVVGVVRHELRHSDFLSFLLNPQERHGLGDTFVTFLIRGALQAADAQDLPVSALDVTLWNLADTEVRREWKSIDILLLDRVHRLAIIIENKLEATEHSDQLRRYRETVLNEFPGWNVLGLYLTPEGGQPSDSAYLPCSYATVDEAVRSLLAHRTTTMGEEVQLVVRHYSQLLQRHVVTESEIADLCRRIYRKHQRALDLIFEHRPDRAAEIHDVLIRLIAETPAVIHDHSTKTIIRFIPKEWDVPGLQHGEGWTPTGRMLLFEFLNDYRGLVLQLAIGPGPNDIRSKLFQTALDHPIFKPAFRSLKKKWNAIYTGRIVLSASEMEELGIDELEEKIRAFWVPFIANELQGFTQGMAPAIRELGGT